MFLTFLWTLRAFKIPVGIQEWLYLLEALSRDLQECSLDRFYFLARSLLVKKESLYDAYDQAFLACFRNFSDAIDFKKELLDWLNQATLGPRPKLPEGIEKLDLETLRKKFLERMKEQQEAHHGGNYWIGTGGTSPFGHSGSHPSGIRVGGPGGGRSAMQVAEERRFQNYRQDRTLDTRQFKVALKQLRQLNRVGAAEELNLEKTLDRTCKNAGDIELVFEASRKNQIELLLFMDVGGSMDSYAHLTEALFSAAHATKHFKSFEHYYFHNCVYQNIYTDMFQRQSRSMEDLFRRHRSSCKVLIVGDACMNPYELFAPHGAIDYWERNQLPGLAWLKRIREHFTRVAWLNPEPEDYWHQHPTIDAVAKTIPMHPFSVQGLGRAITELRK